MNHRVMTLALAASLACLASQSALAQGLRPSSGASKGLAQTPGAAAPAGTAVEQGIATWRCQVFNALGSSARADVTYDASGVATVTLGWGERGGNEAETEFEARTQL